MLTETETYNSSIGEIIEPSAIAYSFDTLGWHIVLGVILLLVALFTLLKYRTYLRNAYRRKAIKDIRQISEEDNQLFYNINRILKIIAIQLYGRNTVASLFGKDWFIFLNSKCEKAVYDNNDYQLFTEAIYNTSLTTKPETAEAFESFAKHWVKKHKA